MNLEHGILMFLIGTTMTVVGFFIAYYVANKVIENEKKELKKKNLNQEYIIIIVYKEKL